MTSRNIVEPANPILSYETALAALIDAPNDVSIQHSAVLSLARAGALDFALREYNRFGLHKLRRHEDVMALGARLSKDFFLRSSGQKALEHARDSAHQYEAAFKDTQGYYSGVNAATMAMLANMPKGTVSERAKAILDILPAPERLTPEDHYFIEASRAEAQLLLGLGKQARESLRRAFNFDPQNFTAHATTLKQFKMILRHREQESDWLSHFSPPGFTHFAGHIFSALPKQQNDDLKIEISDTIQKNHIGFAYGALSAGSDILIAESLLEEGAELHVILPVDEKLFIEQSVRPFGEDWIARYNSCRDRARSVEILAVNAKSPNPSLYRLAGQVAMGQAILQSQMLATDPMQLLLWDGIEKGSYTALHADDWNLCNFNQAVIPLTHARQKPKAPQQPSTPHGVLLKSPGDDAQQVFDSPVEAARKARSLLAKSSNSRIGMATALDSGIASEELDLLAEQALPGTALMNESLACLLAWASAGQIGLTYAGQISRQNGDPVRAFSLTG